MLSTVLYVMAFVSAAPLDIQIAPDQPLPFAYVDETVIIQFRASAPMTLSGVVRLVHAIEAAEEPPTEVPLMGIVLEPGQPYWLPVTSLPPRRGPYNVFIELDGGQPVIEREFCRVDRPAQGGGLPVRATNVVPNPHALAALKSVGINTVVLDASADDLLSLVEDCCNAQLDVSFVVHGPEQAVELARQQSAVTCWYVPADAALETITALRNHDAQQDVVVQCDTPDTVGELLAQGLDQWTVDFAAPNAEALPAFQRAALECGQEALRWHVALEGTDVAGGMTRGLTQALVNGACSVSVSASVVYQDNRFSPSFPELSALNRLVPNMEPAGMAALAPGVSAPLLQRGDEWLMAFWANSENSVTFTINGRNVREPRLSDTMNNMLPLTADDTTISLQALAEPKFLCAAGGNIFAGVAYKAVERQAAALDKNEALRAVIVQDLFEVLKRFVDWKDVSMAERRRDFFTILRTFPYLEQLHQNGRLSEADTALAADTLTKMLRAYSILEQEKGAAFLEPLENTLDRCDQYRSDYSEAETEKHSRRGDAVYRVVGELMQRARRLHKYGRRIEAAALGGVAEWRARSLEFTMEPEETTNGE